MESPERYKLRYTIKVEQRAEGFRREEIDTAHDQGGCDAFVFASIVQGENQTNTLLLGREGRGESLQPLSDVELFKVWAHLAKYLGYDSRGCPKWHRTIARRAFRDVQKVIAPGAPEPKRDEHDH